MSGLANIPHPHNEPVLSYAPGNAERAALKGALTAVGGGAAGDSGRRRRARDPERGHPGRRLAALPRAGAGHACTRPTAPPSTPR